MKQHDPNPRPSAGPDDVIQPPQTMTVDYERKPVIYLPDGKRVLVRRVGF